MSNDFIGNKVRILIVDDHPIVRQGVAQLLSIQPDLLLCCEASDSEEALMALRHCQHDLVIMDLSLRQQSGFDLISKVIEEYPQLPILVMSIHDEALYVERALHLGVRGYLMKHQAIGSINSAIRKVLSGGIYLEDDIQQQIVDRLFAGRAVSKVVDPIAKLSVREIELLRLIGSGQTTREIAGQFHRSIKTIEAHRANIKTKLGLKNGTELIGFAVRWLETVNQEN